MALPVSRSIGHRAFEAPRRHVLPGRGYRPENRTAGLPNECMTWMREAGFDETYLVPLAGKHTAVVGKKCAGPTRSLS